MKHRISLRIATLCGAAFAASGCISRNAIDYLPAHIRAEAAYAGAADRGGPVVIRIPQELREETKEEARSGSRPDAAVDKPVPGLTLDRLLGMPEPSSAPPPVVAPASVAPASVAPLPVEPPTLRLRSILPGDGTGAPGPRSDGSFAVPSGAGHVSFRIGEPPDPAGLGALSRLVGEKGASAVVLTAGAADPTDFEALLAARRGMQAIAAALPADLRIAQRFDPAVPAREIRAAVAR